VIFPEMTSQQNDLGGNFVKTVILLLFEIIKCKTVKKSCKEIILKGEFTQNEKCLCTQKKII